MTNTTCSVDGCLSEHYAKGVCNNHYRKLRKYGTPLAGKSYAKYRGGSVTNEGYRLISERGLQRMEHIAIAERVLGKPIPRGAQVHHINGDRSDNRNVNLVICPSQAYHSLLHRRQAAYDACGNPGFRKCWLCLEYDDPTVMGKNGEGFHHIQCRREYDQQRRVGR